MTSSREGDLSGVRTAGRGGRCELSREAPSSCIRLAGRPEFEEWVASSLRDVLRERVIDADPQPPEDADGWAKAWPEQGTKDARSPELLERAPEHSSPFLRRELDGMHRCATAVRMGDGGLAVSPKVGDPADLAVGGLHEPPTVELDHANRHRSNPAGPPTACREEHVRSANLINNMPATLVLLSGTSSGQLEAQLRLPFLMGALAGADLGPNLTPVGSLSTMLWLVIVRRRGVEVSSLDYLKLGAIITPALLLATGLLIAATFRA
jgi:Arsenical pump membrane protein